MNRIGLGHIIIVSQLILFVVLLLSPIKPKPYGDPDFYPEAKQLSLMIKGEHFEEPLIIDKAPLPSIFYTVPFLFVNGAESNYWWAAVFFNMFFIILGVYSFVKGIELLRGKKAAFLALGLICIFPMHIYYSLGINAEVFAFSFVAIAIYQFIKFSKQEQISSMIFGFVFLLLAFFARPNAVIVLPVLIVVACLFWVKTKKSASAWLAGMSIATLIIFQLSMAAIENVQKKHLEGNAQKGYLAYVVNLGYYQFRDEPWDWRYWQNTHRKGSVDYKNWKNSFAELNELRDSDSLSATLLIKKYYITDLKERPLSFIGQCLIKAAYGQIFIINSKPMKGFAKFSQNGLPEYIFVHLMINLVNIALIILSILFFIRMPKNDLLYWILFSIWFGILIFPSVSYMEPRYLFPSRIVLVAFATLYLVDSTKLFSKQTH